MLSMRAQPGGAVTRTLRSPFASAVPANTVEPFSLRTGALSPVIEDSSISPEPPTTTPSTGSTEPAPRWSTMPRRTSSVRTRTSSPSTTAQTLSERTTMPSRSARWARA